MKIENIHTCKFCGQEFITEITQRRFCSKKCRMEYQKIKRRRNNLDYRSSERVQSWRNSRLTKDIGLTASACGVNCFECPYPDCIMD